MRFVGDVRRPNRDRREKVIGRPVGAARRRVVEQIETPAHVRLPQRRQLVEMFLHELPRPMQRLVRHHVGIDQRFVRHQVRAVRRELKRAERIPALRRMLALVRIRRTGVRRDALVDDVHVHLFEQRGIAVRQTHLNAIGVVDVLVHGPRRRVPHVVLLEADGLAADVRRAAALNAEVHLRRVVADRFRPLTWIQHTDRHGGARREAVAAALRVADHRDAPPVRRRRQRRETRDFRLDHLFGNHHGRARFVLRLDVTGSIDEFKPHGYAPNLVAQAFRPARAALKGCATCSGRHGLAETSRPRRIVDLYAERQIRDAHPQRLEQRDILICTSRLTCGDDRR